MLNTATTLHLVSIEGNDNITKLMRTVLLLIIAIFSFHISTSQNNFCGFDGTRNKMASSKIVVNKTEQQVNNLLYNSEINQIRVGNRPQNTVTIPVVIHIVHQNGVENLADTQVVNVINQLNLRFQNAAPFNQTTGTNIGIQFCRASVDPFGNATNGITRDVSPYTNITYNNFSEDVSLKNVNRWEPKLYLNIWVIKSISSFDGVIGYSSFPNWAGTNFDGIVMQYNFFNSEILSHEIGHYFGLLHTFNGGCTNNNCLLDGDLVCDTPPDATSNGTCRGNSCNTDTNDTTGTSPFITNVNDLPNYMDYTTCMLSFTQGQGNRMNNSILLFRNQLLASNGCGSNPGGLTPTASFSFNENCFRGYDFKSTSINALGAQWDFDGDGKIDNYGDSVNFQFPQTGFYRVTLFAAGYGGTDTISQLILVKAKPYSTYPLKKVTGFNTSPVLNKPVFCRGAVVTLFGEPGMASYQWSTGQTTQDISFIPDTAFSISLTCIDQNGISYSTCIPAAAEPIGPSIAPSLSIVGSDTSFCAGDTVNILAQLAPTASFAYLYTNQQIIGFLRDTIFHEVFLFATNQYRLIQADSNFCLTGDTLNILGASTPQKGTITKINNSLSYYYGTHRQWFFNGSPIPNSDSITITAQQTGCYNAYAWYTNPDCGSFANDTVCVSLNPFLVKKITAKGYFKNGKVSVEWRTINEINCKWMVVEKSMDGTIFETLTTIAAVGFGNNAYTEMDPMENNASSIVYYRIRCVDIDGKYYYSNSFSVRIEQQTSHLSLSPNPANNILNLSIASNNAEKRTVIIINPSGQKVMQLNFELQKGINLISIKIDRLSAGLYYLTDNSGSGLGEKFIKLK